MKYVRNIVQSTKARLAIKALIVLALLVSNGASAHETALCPQWPAINPDKPLKETKRGTELGMLNMRFIAKSGETNCNPYEGQPNSCEQVILQWSRRYDVFPFPLGNRIESEILFYTGGIPAEAICQ